MSLDSWNIPLAFLLPLVVIFVCYGLIITRATRMLRKLSPYVSAVEPDEGVSLVIAARNEEKHIAACLDALLAQDYPKEKIEIIVVDDHSEDHTAAIAGGFAERGVRLIRMEASDGWGKKAALAKGIGAAVHEYIMTTDADCTHPSTWVSTMLSFRKEKDAVFVAAPVKFRKEQTLLEGFQSLDFLALQGITAAAQSLGKFHMCNGANLLYAKDAFERVGGFKGIDQIASGDDMLLMEKMAEAYPNSVQYCFAESATVVTEPALSWKAFIQQRIRWASKSTKYKSAWIKGILLVVYVLNVSMVILVLASLWDLDLLKAWLVLVLLKTWIELPFMIRIGRFFGKSYLIRWFLPAQPLHAVYTLVAGSFGLFTHYEWKGRRTH